MNLLRSVLQGFSEFLEELIVDFKRLVEVYHCDETYTRLVSTLLEDEGFRCWRCNEYKFFDKYELGYYRLLARS